ncbi:hypothetical protein Drorol1_Dr00018989 [Drosera rotundifolia]
MGDCEVASDAVVVDASKDLDINGSECKVNHVGHGGRRKPASRAQHVDGDDFLIRKKHSGVRMRKNGKWSVEVSVPASVFRKKKLYLGTFNTFEEAVDAFNKKRLEVSLLTGRGSKLPASGSVVVEPSKDFHISEDERVASGTIVNNWRIPGYCYVSNLNANVHKNEGNAVYSGGQGTTPCSSGASEPLPNVEVVDYMGGCCPGIVGWIRNYGSADTKKKRNTKSSQTHQVAIMSSMGTTIPCTNQSLIA